MKHLAIGMILLLPLYAAHPAGFAHVTGSQLKTMEKGMAGKKLASNPLGNYGNHTMQLSHREASGEAELHETMNDIFVVESGEATLVVGGTVASAKTTAPNEVRGPSIQGGEKKKLGAGDIVHIPAKTPHQLLVDSGKQFTYAVIKVAAQ